MRDGKFGGRNLDLEVVTFAVHTCIPKLGGEAGVCVAMGWQIVLADEESCDMCQVLTSLMDIDLRVHFSTRSHAVTSNVGHARMSCIQ